MKKTIVVLWLLIAVLFTPTAMAQDEPQIESLLPEKGAKAPKAQKTDVAYQRAIEGTTWFVTRVESKYNVFYSVDSDATISSQRADNGGTVVTVNRKNGTSFTFCMPNVRYPNDAKSFIFWKPRTRAEINGLISLANL